MAQDSIFLRLSRALLAVWIVALVLALFPLTEDPATPVKMLLTHVFLCASALLCLLDALMFPARPRSGGAIFAVPAACFALALCAFPFVSTLQQGMLDAARWWLILFVVAGVFARAYTETAQVTRFVQAFLLASTLSSVYGFMQMLGLDPMPWGLTDTYEYLNLPATYGNPNLAGHALVVAILLSVWLARHNREPLYLCVTLVAGLHLYLTHMRAGWIAILAALLLAVLFAIVRSVAASQLKAASISLGLGLGVAALAAGAGLYFLNVRPELLPPLDSSLQLRLNSYLNAAEMLKAYPFTGTGAGRYAAETPAFWTPFEKYWFALEERQNAHVHNEALELGAEFGLGGVLAFFLLFFGGILGGLYGATQARFGEDRSLALALAAVICALGVDSLLGFNLHAPVSAALAFAACGLVAGVYGRNNVKQGAAHPRAAIPALLLVLAAGGSAWFEVRSFEAEMQYQRAQGARLYAASMQGNPQQFNYGLDEAALSFQRAKEWKPWEARYSHSAALAESSRANFSTAHQYWMQALPLAPNDPHVLHGVLDSAVNDFVGAKNPEAENFLRSTQAEKLLSQLLAFAPDWSETFVLRGRLADEMQGDYAAAKVLYQEGLERGAKNKTVLCRLLARTCGRLGDAVGAQPYLRMAVEENPVLTDTWEQLKNSGYPQSHAQEWLELLHSSWLKTRGNPAAHAYLGNECALMYQSVDAAYFSLALAILDKTSEVAPDAPQLLETRAALELRIAETPVAPVPDNGAMTSDSQAQTPVETPQSELETLVAQLNAPSEKRDEAVLEFLGGVLEIAAASTPEELRQKAGLQLEAARRSLAELPLGETAQYRALGYLGECLLHAGEWQHAADALGTACPNLQGEERAIRLSQLSDAFAGLGATADALAAAREAFALLPEHNGMKLALARRLVADGKGAEAVFQYMTLLRRMDAADPDYALVQGELDALKAGQKNNNRQGEGDAPNE